MCTYFSDLSLIDFCIKIGDSSLSWHATSYYCKIIGSIIPVIASCEPKSCKSISLWSNELLAYPSAN